MTGAAPGAGPQQARRPRIIAYAYACTPGAGSEGGAGWAWAEMLAQIADVWVLARPFDIRLEEITARLELLHPAARPNVIMLDIPRWAGGGRPTASPRFVRLRYLLWQVLALREARRLHRRQAFDIAWHLTFSNVWFGTSAGMIGPPLVYGPVGGAVGPPWRLVPRLGPQGAAQELIRAMARRTARYLNPIVRQNWRRAALILAQNRETRDWFPARVRSKVEIFPNTILEAEEVASAPVPPRPADARPVALFAGRLIPMKGIALALEAIRLLPVWRFIICGSGPDEARLRSLAIRLGIDDRVEFRGWTERVELMGLMHAADVFLFPSFHEEAGWAVAEALIAGLPVVCLDRGGPVALGGHGVQTRWPRETIRALAIAVEAARTGPRPVAPVLDRASRLRELTRLLELHGLSVLADGDRPADADPGE